MRVRGLLAMFRNRRPRETIYASESYWNETALQFPPTQVSLWPNEHLNVLYDRMHIDLLAQMLPDMAGLRIVDLGCGTGRISETGPAPGRGGGDRFFGLDRGDRQDFDLGRQSGISEVVGL